MALVQSARFKRGATWTDALLCVSGDISEATCRAVIKSNLNGLAPGDAAPVIAEWTVLKVDHVDPEEETSLPGWVLTIEADASEGIAPGTYVTDARIERPGGVIQTATKTIYIEERVTEAA